MYKNKIIIPTGYMGSGSSAVTDLLSEYDSCDTRNADFEYVFLHCPDGLFDLEDKLLIGNNTIRSDEAIHSYLSIMKELYIKDGHWINDYKSKIGPDFYKYCEQFIEDLGVYKFNNSYWYYQQIPCNTIMKIILLFRRIIGKISMGHISFDRPTTYKELMMSFPDEKTFYSAAKKYLFKIFSNLGCNENNIVLDQLLLPHNIYRINNYFDDNIRIIVVERDPRDVFILNKYVWNKKHVAVPYPLDANLFCRFYSKMRTREKLIDDNKIIRIHFEDLIYLYDDTVKIIESFLGLLPNDHVRKHMHLDPNKSVINTQLFNSEQYPQEEIAIIEKELKEYLYAFPYEIHNKALSREIF